MATGRRGRRDTIAGCTPRPAAVDWAAQRQEADMIRIVIVMSAIVLAGSTGAEAAARKSAKAWQTAAVAARPAAPARPAWAGPGDCYTDDGYGRYWPCSGGPCGR